MKLGQGQAEHLDVELRGVTEVVVGYILCRETIVERFRSLKKGRGVDGCAEGLGRVR